MKKILFLSFCGLLLSACTGSNGNPDENFDEFYQGSPQDFVPDEAGNSADLAGGFEFRGGNEAYQCTVTCLPNS